MWSDSPGVYLLHNRFLDCHGLTDNADHTCKSFKQYAAQYYVIVPNLNFESIYLRIAHVYYDIFLKLVAYALTRMVISCCVIEHRFSHH